MGKIPSYNIVEQIPKQIPSLQFISVICVSQQCMLLKMLDYFERNTSYFLPSLSPWMFLNFNIFIKAY